MLTDGKDFAGTSSTSVLLAPPWVPTSLGEEHTFLTRARAELCGHRTSLLGPRQVERMCLSLLSPDSPTTHRWVHKAHWTVFCNGDNTCGWVPWTLQNEPGKDVASMHVEMLQNCGMIRELTRKLIFSQCFIKHTLFHLALDRGLEINCCYTTRENILFSLPNKYLFIVSL